MRGDSKRPFSKLATEVSLLSLETPLVNSSLVLGLGVREPGLMMRDFVADPIKRLGERMGDPLLLDPPLLSTLAVMGDCFDGVNPRGRIFAADLGTARYDISADDCFVYESQPLSGLS